MGRTGNVIVLIVYLLTVPAGVFYYFTGRDMAYPPSMAGIFAGVLALAGVALMPVAFHHKPAEPNAPARDLPTKTSWGILIGFLALMAAVVAYYMLKGR